MDCHTLHFSPLSISIHTAGLSYYLKMVGKSTHYFVHSCLNFWNALIETHPHGKRYIEIKHSTTPTR